MCSVRAIQVSRTAWNYQCTYLLTTNFTSAEINTFIAERIPLKQLILLEGSLVAFTDANTITLYTLTIAILPWGGTGIRNRWLAKSVTASNSCVLPPSMATFWKKLHKTHWNDHCSSSLHNYYPLHVCKETSAKNSPCTHWKLSLSLHTNVRVCVLTWPYQVASISTACLYYTTSFLHLIIIDCYSIHSCEFSLAIHIQFSVHIDKQFSRYPILW